jgi:hypothetical protein
MASVETAALAAREDMASVETVAEREASEAV